MLGDISAVPADHSAVNLLHMAANGPATPDLSPLWLQYGAIGLMAALLLWFAWRAYKREADRADKLEAEVARLNQVMLDQSKSSTESTTAMRDVIAFLQAEHHGLRRGEH